jgi:hypothetical protein
MAVVVGVTTIADGRATQSAALLGGLAAAGTDGVVAPSSRHDAAPRVAIFGDSVGFSLVLALGNSTVIPNFQRTPSDVRLGCGIALSPSPPNDSPDACDDPAGRFAATASTHDVSVAVMVSCQWELLTQALPGRGDEYYVIGHPAFDTYVRMRYEDVANQLSAAGVDRILWATCPYMSTSVGVEGLDPQFVDSRDPARVDRLNAVITSMADDRPDVEVLAFSEWVNERIDNAAVRPDGSHFEYRGHNPAADEFVRSVNAALGEP